MPEFQAVYDEFRSRIRRYLSRLVGASEAEDLAQEVFDRLRSPSFQRAGEAPRDGRRALTDRSPGIEEALVRREANDCVRRYIEALPPRYRSVVILSEDEGLTRARARLRRELGDGCSFYRDARGELACDQKAEGVSPGGRPPSIAWKKTLG
jgi:DNA-directed RNA polymerase specialized sigma24 family protein